MADSKTYYWVDQNSNFGAGDNKVTYGEEMPKGIDPKQLALFIKNKWVSTEKTVSQRQLSELEKLREQVKKGGSDITQEQLDAASTTSVQTDLDKIKELEGLVNADVKTVQDKLDLIQVALEDVKLPLKKEELEGIKALFEG